MGRPRASITAPESSNCSRVVTLTKTAWSRRATISISPNGVFLRRARMPLSLGDEQHGGVAFGGHAEAKPHGRA
jgi:hypothetical protein